MSQMEKLLHELLDGRHDSNFRFQDLQRILERAGGKCHVTGDHFRYVFTNVRKSVNIQPAKDGKAKPYQVCQVRVFLTTYKLEVK